MNRDVADDEEAGDRGEDKVDGDREEVVDEEGAVVGANVEEIPVADLGGGAPAGHQRKGPTDADEVRGKVVVLDKERDPAGHQRIDCMLEDQFLKPACLDDRRGPPYCGSILRRTGSRATSERHPPKGDEGGGTCKEIANGPHGICGLEQLGLSSSSSSSNSSSS